MTLRVAGGWVRDKLLGLESNDIDIALDTMMGREFAERVNAYLAATGGDVAGVGVIAANPEQSKHLETATMRVHGVWLDLVHLRSESYAEGSRIPTAVGFGTPAQDALRRDLTVNALFYNLDARSVEDWTGQGVADLRARVARTPAPPRETLLDDPLRALRAVRLAARLGLRLDAALEGAAAGDDVRAALAQKVSRERVGVELVGMLAGPAPCDALRTLCRLGLAPAVFALPQPLAAAAPPCAPWACLHAARALEAVLRAAPDAAAGDGWAALSADADARRAALLAAWLLPLRRCAVPAGGKPGGKTAPLSQPLIRDALKLRAKDAEQAQRLLDGADAFAAHLAAPPDAAPSRAALGRTLRAVKAQWRVALALAAALRVPGVLTLLPCAAGWLRACAAAAHAVRPATDVPPARALPAAGEAPEPEAVAACRELSAAPLAAEGVAAAAAAAAALAARIEALHLEGVWDAKPLVSGGEALAALALAQAGPALGAWMDALLTWQLAHEGADKAAALAWLAQHKGQAAPPPAEACEA